MYLVAKRLWRVVHNDRLGEVPTQDAQLLDEVSTHTDAVLPEESVTNQLPQRVQQVQKFVCIHLS